MTPYRTYNVPLELVSDYRNCRVVLRARDPVALVDKLSAEPRDDVIMLQLLDISADLEPLSRCGYGIPVEVVLNDPEREAGKLYRVMQLQRAHPLRIVIRVVAGFSKAVKVASALHLPIKLEGNQPDSSVIDELCSTLDYFLHDRTVSQPIEYFSGLMMARLHKLPVNLWDIQEEDPATVRYITDAGTESVARKPFEPGRADLDSFRFALTKRVLNGDEECVSCRFFPECGGYFKWPDPGFSCEGVKRVFSKLRNAADELQDDLASYPMEHAP